MAHEITMSQNVNILIQSLARSFPGAHVEITSYGPIQVTNGKLHCGTATKTELALWEDQRKEHPLSAGELVADNDLELVKKLNRAAGRRRSKRCSK